MIISIMWACWMFFERNLASVKSDNMTLNRLTFKPSESNRIFLAIKIHRKCVKFVVARRFSRKWLFKNRFQTKLCYTADIFNTQINHFCVKRIEKKIPKKWHNYNDDRNMYSKIDFSDWRNCFWFTSDASLKMTWCVRVWECKRYHV